MGGLREPAPSPGPIHQKISENENCYGLFVDFTSAYNAEPRKTLLPTLTIAWTEKDYFPTGNVLQNTYHL